MDENRRVFWAGMDPKLRMDRQVIHGRGLYLRPARPADYPEWWALRSASRDELRKVEPDWSDASLEVDVFLRRLDAEHRAIASGAGLPVLIFRSDGLLLGGLQIGPVMGRAARVGVWIGSPYVGRGYAIRAVHAALGFAFDRMGLETVSATVLPKNAASIRGLDYLGFYHFGREIVCAGRRLREHLVYAVTRETFRDGRFKDRAEQREDGVSRETAERAVA